MIKVTLYRNDDHIYRICLKGHAGYAEHGDDIVCSAVSMLTINTLNAIEAYTDEPTKQLALNLKKGYIDVLFIRRQSGEYAPEAELLLKTMSLGLESIKEMYGEKYIEIQNK